MGIGASIAMIALGAILTFATCIDTSGLGFEAAGISFYGIDLDTVGIILMVAGGLGLVVAMVAGSGRRYD
jgi:uncharacterized membrane protein